MSSTRRGFLHEDDERIVQVVFLKRGLYAVALKHKSSEGLEVRFSISGKGARILLKLLRSVMKGNGKQINDRLSPTGTSVKILWTRVEPEKQA